MRDFVDNISQKEEIELEQFKEIVTHVQERHSNPFRGGNSEQLQKSIHEAEKLQWDQVEGQLEEIENELQNVYDKIDKPLVVNNSELTPNDFQISLQRGDEDTIN